MNNLQLNKRFLRLRSLISHWCYYLSQPVRLQFLIGEFRSIIIQYVGQAHRMITLTIFTDGTAIGVAVFDDAVKANVLKSKMSGNFVTVSAQHNGNDIDTLVRFRAWLYDTHQRLVVGTQ